MRLHAYASLPHYAEHIDAVWRHLPPATRGTRFSPVGREWPGWVPAGRGRPPLAEPVLVAGFADSLVMKPRRVVLLEHGAGQSYVGTDSGSYAGGDGHEHAILFLCPSETVAARWAARYPETRTAVVGCPKLDPWHARLRPRTPSRFPSVAVTFHWDCPIVPETRSAWHHYADALPKLHTALAVAGGELLGHAHPRLWGAVERVYRRENIERVRSFADVLDRADLLIADNTSALYEFASTGRPVLVLDAPWYRRDVEHGLRFWSHVPGHSIGRPDDLLAGVRDALDDRPGERALRERAVAHVYAATDGRAGQRAATAIEEALHALPQETS